MKIALLSGAFVLFIGAFLAGYIAGFSYDCGEYVKPAPYRHCVIEGSDYLRQQNANDLISAGFTIVDPQGFEIERFSE